MECQKCGKETFLPFRCPYCGGYFCTEHRLPENHDCPKLEHARAPLRALVPTFSQASQMQSPHEYTITYIPVKRERKFYFSGKELEHLAVAALLVLGVGFSLGFSPRVYAELGGSIMLFAFAIIVASSFLAHELAHKFTAQKAGLLAEFRLIFIGLVLTAISIISPIFKIISPGAVLISGFTEKDNVGKISIAGPSANIVLSVMLAGLFTIVKQSIFMYAAAVNAWIALFNIIPFGILDGYKVFTWSKSLWGLAFTTSLALTILIYRHAPF